MPHLRTFPVARPDPGVTRQGLSEAPGLMVVAFGFEKDALGKPHSHPHVQSTYVERGRFRFTIGADSFEVGPGDSFVIPSGATHGCVCLEPGRLIDTFTPRRDVFL
jgi:quercetin dioxygenase-like cupin family protein